MHMLTWHSFAPHGESFRVARQHFIFHRRAFVHSHDYAEVFWIEKETGLHLINGHRLPLAPGDLYFIRPQDAHDLKATQPAGMTLVNISFPAETLEFLRHRYFPDSPAFWGGDQPIPIHYQISRRTLQKLSAEANALAGEPRIRLNLERFLLHLLHVLSVQPRPSDLTAIPDWLKTALGQMRQPEHFENGAAELARLTGKTPEHIARLVRQKLDRTPTDLVNEARLAYAAGQMSMTAKPIIEICMECGFASLSHFYKLFKARYRLSPRKYRMHR